MDFRSLQPHHTEIDSAHTPLSYTPFGCYVSINGLQWLVASGQRRNPDEQRAYQVAVRSSPSAAVTLKHKVHVNLLLKVSNEMLKYL